MKMLLSFLLTLFLTISALAQDVKVTIDFESAKAVIEAFAKSKISNSELDRIAQLEGNRTLIKKAESTEIVFKTTLKSVIETGKTTGEDPFDWQTVRRNLKDVQTLTVRIEREQLQLLADINLLIRNYTPQNLNAEVKARLLVGGGSLGFTIDQDTALNVALQQLGNDFEALKYLLAHELYHSIQAIGDEKRKKTLAKPTVDPPVNIINTYTLAANVYREGTATFVGDFSKIRNPLAFSREQIAEDEKNQNRMRQNFALFEALVFRAYNDPDADIDQLYRTGFTTSFDETSYYVGYRMAQIIEKYKGKVAVAELVNRNPLEFFKEYIEIYKKHDEPRAIKFSQTVEKILLEMQTWSDKI